MINLTAATTSKDRDNWEINWKAEEKKPATVKDNMSDEVAEADSK